MLILSTHAHASQTWNSFCANIKADSIQQNDRELQARNYSLQTTGNQNVQLNSKRLMVSQTGKSLSKDLMQRITNITSTGLLSIFLDYQMNNCNKKYYTDTITPALQQMKQNEQLTFTWNDLMIRNAKTAYTARQFQLTVQKISNNTQVRINFSGLTEISHHANPNILLPKQGDLNLTTLSSNYPLILASTSGNTDSRFYNSLLPLTINHLIVSNNLTTITAAGNTTLDTKLRLQAANGKITISNMNQLISNSDSAKIERLKTALILAKFAGRSVNNNTLEWDIRWKNNLFKVNNVPIPVW